VMDGLHNEWEESGWQAPIATRHPPIIVLYGT
jgi:hypothetical protein